MKIKLKKFTSLRTVDEKKVKNLTKFDVNYQKSKFTYAFGKR